MTAPCHHDTKGFTLRHTFGSGYAGLGLIALYIFQFIRSIRHVRRRRTRVSDLPKVIQIIRAIAINYLAALSLRMRLQNAQSCPNHRSE